MEMARIAPDRVKGLVLANTGHHPKREGEEIKRQAMIDLGHKSMERLAAHWIPPMLDPARAAEDQALLADLTAMVLRADAEQHERQIRALIGRPDANAYLGDITCPVLLVTARQDSWSPIAQHEEIGAAIGGFRTCHYRKTPATSRRLSGRRGNRGRDHGMASTQIWR